MRQSWLASAIVDPGERVETSILDCDDGTVTLCLGLGAMDGAAINFPSRDELQSFIDRCQSALQDYDSEVAEASETSSE